jgi:hypothetical protein
MRGCNLSFVIEPVLPLCADRVDAAFETKTSECLAIDGQVDSTSGYADRRPRVCARGHTPPQAVPVDGWL